MKVASQSYTEELREDLQDPEEAAAYLAAAIEEDSLEIFLLALRDVVEARGVALSPSREATRD